MAVSRTCQALRKEGGSQVAADFGIEGRTPASRPPRHLGNLRALRREEAARRGAPVGRSRAAQGGGVIRFLGAIRLRLRLVFAEWVCATPGITDTRWRGGR